MKNLKLISKILKMYYIDGLTQTEIAGKLSISRIKVARFLYYARDNKMVEVKINLPLGEFDSLENQFEKKFGLNDCRIVPALENREELYKYLAFELSDILERILSENEYVGVSWGTTLEGLGKYLEVKKRKDIKILPVCGSVGVEGEEYATNATTRLFSEKLGGMYYTINVPACLDTREAKEILEKDSNTLQILKHIKNITTSILAASDISLETSFGKLGHFTKGDIDYLNSLGIVGILNFEFLDRDGNLILNKLTDRILRLYPLDSIKSTKNSIMVSFGQQKVDIMRAILKGRLVNMLLTDESTARQILS